MSDLERTEVYNQQIKHPSAWTRDSLGGKAGVSRALTAAELAAIDELLAKTAHLKPQEVTREQFTHPALDSFLTETWETVMHGRGVVVITGISPSRYSEDQYERIWWGFGTHWGYAVVQSPRGDRLGHVRYIPPSKEVATRAYTSNNELYPHCDANEIVGLFCVQKAKSGGLSSLISSMQIHNEIQANRPDLLEPLYEGYRFATREAELRGQELTPYKVPVFCYLNGVVSCYYNPGYIYRAEKYTGPMPPKLAEAMKYMDTLTHREDLVVSFMLEPGEMSIWNNYTMLHSRSEFEDYEEFEKKRHLLRLWLDVENNQGRPVIPVYHRDLVAGT